MKAHGGVNSYTEKEIVFERREVTEMDESKYDDGFEHCSYCGSITVADMLRLMQTPETHYSGSDWKYGWPHKFYIDAKIEPRKRNTSAMYENGKETYGYSIVDKEHLKFYSTHLLDATEEQIKEWNEKVMPKLGIEFKFDNEKLMFGAPNSGYQTWGNVS